MPDFDIEVIYEAEPRTITVSGDSLQDVWQRREQIAAELPRGVPGRARVLSVAPSEGTAARPVSPPRNLLPPARQQHVGCPDCGMVTTVPLQSDEQPPWCVHHDSNYAWRDPHPDTQAGDNPWTRMVRVEVQMPGPVS